MSALPQAAGAKRGAAQRPAACRLHVEDAPPILKEGLEAIAELYPSRFCAQVPTERIRFVQTDATKGGSLCVSRDEQGRINIAFSDSASAFRALGAVMGYLESGLAVEGIAQTRGFASVGAMLDLSRNAVMRPETLRTYIRFLALMGINRLMLYLEDTYEVPGQPVFGYFRGGYSQAELKQIDDYAAAFGIEVVPCIQTLGHLEQVLQWPQYAKFRDTAGVLMVGSKEVDAWVEEIIRAASAPFRSRRIHIGMDEAHGIGSGLYRLQNGLRPPFEILCEHLQHTAQTCERLGLSPMIWSDMFFRLSSRTNNYYDTDSRIDPCVAARIPAGVELVYWDYYHTDSAFYEDWIERHRQMGKEPLLASGVWTWNRFWAQLPHSLAVAGAGVRAAREKGLKEIFTTCWGDDGTECDMFSALPAIQCFAQLAYGEEAQAAAEAHFAGACDGTFAAWVAAGRLDQLPCKEPFQEANPSKWIFWHDPLLGFLDQQITEPFVAHYERLADELAAWPAPRGEDARLELPRRFAAALALKARLHHHLRTRYRERDMAYLREVLEQTLPQLQAHVCALREYHRKMWFANNRVFGWEVLERRYAGLQSRLETLGQRLDAFLADPQAPIDELECRSEAVWPMAATHDTTLRHHQTATPSYIS